MAIGFTINDLKKHLGPGLGLRKSKYLIEIPIPGIEGRTLNILCRSAGLPERNINTTTIWHKGRQYNVKGETDYVGTYDISIVDDSEMKIRQLFDKWAKMIDNSKPANTGILGASFEEIAPGFLDNVADVVETANTVKNAIENPQQILDFALNIFTGDVSMADYQIDVNIWQLDNFNNKVYGYKLENAFPKQIGIVTLEDESENTLSEFSVTFAFSEFTPLKGPKRDVLETIVGDTGSDILNGIEALFE